MILSYSMNSFFIKMHILYLYKPILMPPPSSIRNVPPPPTFQSVGGPIAYLLRQMKTSHINLPDLPAHIKILKQTFYYIHVSQYCKLWIMQ